MIEQPGVRRRDTGGVAQSVVNDLARGWCWGSASSPVPSMDKRTGPEGDDNSRRLLALWDGQERRERLEERGGCARATQDLSGPLMAR